MISPVIGLITSIALIGITGWALWFLWREEDLD